MEKQTVTIIMYHYVRNLKKSRYPEIKGLDLALFQEQLDFLEKQFHFITTEELLAAAKGTQTLPGNSLLLTFDDGYLDHYTNVFPILKERGIHGFFSMPGKILAEQKLLDVNKIHFILASTSTEDLLSAVYERLDYYRGREYPIPPTEELYQKLAQPNRFDPAKVIFIKRLLQVELEENLRNQIVNDLFIRCVGIPEDSFAQELYMSMDQVELMQREGMCFGIHGYEHYWMNRLSAEELREDIEKALDVFTRIVPREWICCYPYGSSSDTVIEFIRGMGAVAGLCTEARVADLQKDNIFNLPRLDTNDFPPKNKGYQVNQVL